MLERGSGGFGADRSTPDLRVLDGIASWCGGLHGSMPLQDALTSLAQGFRAEGAVLSRLHRNQDQPKAVCIYDSRPVSSDAVLLTRPLCQDVMGYLFTKARTSTIWFLSDHVEDENWAATPTLEHWQAARQIREIVVVALEGSLQQQDYLEFHFTRDLAYSEKLEFESLMPTLVRAWAGRKTGLVTRTQMDERMIRARKAAEATRLKPDAPILGVSNPAKLSRAEFRVCVMLSRGLSVKALTEELGLSESTVRSHLRSIYSKTEVSGMQELMYRILSALDNETDKVVGRL